MTVSVDDGKRFAARSAMCVGRYSKFAALWRSRLAHVRMAGTPGGRSGQPDEVACRQAARGAGEPDQRAGRLPLAVHPVPMAAHRHVVAVLRPESVVRTVERVGESVEVVRRDVLLLDPAAGLRLGVHPPVRDRERHAFPVVEVVRLPVVREGRP
jgi:hypothetical protein